MRNARRLVLLGGLAWLLAVRRRRRETPAPRAVVGFADGSSESVPVDAFEHEALVTAAREALVP